MQEIETERGRRMRFNRRNLIARNSDRRRLVPLNRNSQRKHWALQATFILLITVNASAGSDPELAKFLQGTAVTPALSGIQVGILQRNEITKTFAYGFAQRAGDVKEPLRVQHKVRVASISKLLVAVGVMRLVERGYLTLDNDVSNYLGWKLRNPLFPQTEITLRMLLDHTSSVRDGDRYYIAAGGGRLQDFFDPNTDFWDAGAHWADRREEVPGSYFQYANLNSGLLAEVIERVSGQRFDQFMEHEVIAPLNMTGSFNPCSLSSDQRAAGFRKRDPSGRWDPRGPWYTQVDGDASNCFYGMTALDDPEKFLISYPLGSNASLFSPQGGFRGNVIDLMALLKLFSSNGRLGGQAYLTPESITQMLAPSWSLNARGDNGVSSGEAEPGGAFDGLMTSYGLSVHRIDPRSWGFLDAPELLVGHLGEAHGVLSSALLDPQTGNGIVIIITGTADDPANHPGHSPLYRVEESVITWWLDQLNDGTASFDP